VKNGVVVLIRLTPGALSARNAGISFSRTEGKSGDLPYFVKFALNVLRAREQLLFVFGILTGLPRCDEIATNCTRNRVVIERHGLIRVLDDVSVPCSSPTGCAEGLREETSRRRIGPIMGSNVVQVVLIRIAVSKSDQAIEVRS
jgi:hypothetical protein